MAVSAHRGGFPWDFGIGVGIWELRAGGLVLGLGVWGWGSGFGVGVQGWRVWPTYEASANLTNLLFFFLGPHNPEP